MPEESKAAIINMDSIPLSVVMPCSTVVFPLLVRSQTGDFHNLQEATGTSKGVLGTREA
jgi:hypothetical protein